jgi:hypothetical protein
VRFRRPICPRIHGNCFVSTENDSWNFFILNSKRNYYENNIIDRRCRFFGRRCRI